MNPEFTPPCSTRKGGSLLMLASISNAIRRSDKAPISAIARARVSVRAGRALRECARRTACRCPLPHRPKARRPPPRPQLEPVLLASLRRFPVVGLVGSRQVGKTTLARAVARRFGESVYLGLERPSDAARLADPELYLEAREKRLVVIDEIQRNQGLFPVLRSLVDARRKNGRFLILGSASPDLSRQAAESLAGRVLYHELAPFTLEEIGGSQRPALMKLWNRGGFPGSYLTANDARSLEWREAFIDTHLQRDLPALGGPQTNAQFARMTRRSLEAIAETSFQAMAEVEVELANGKIENQLWYANEGVMIKR